MNDNDCPVKWCAYDGPHRHTTASPSRPGSTLTTAEKEMLSDAMIWGYDHVLEAVESIVRGGLR